MLLTAGSPAGGQAPSLYAYHVGENRWHRLQIAAPPGRQASDLVSQNRAWTYDPGHDLVLMVLGGTRTDRGRAEVFGLRYDHEKAGPAQ